MSESRLSWPSTWVLTLLRMAIGWHLLYEGVVKVLSPRWTSEPYLMDSTWRLAEYFRRIAESPGALRAVDLVNVWGLTIIGLVLVLGLATRLSAFLGALLLSLYYVSNPPFVGLKGVAGEGSYLIVNKNLIEAITLLTFVVIPGAWTYGLDRLVSFSRQRRREAVTASSRVAPDANTPAGVGVYGRRQLLRNMMGLPAVGALGYAVYHKRRWDSLEEKRLKEAGVDAVTSPTLKAYAFSTLGDLKGKMTYGQIGKLKVSRVIMGGNLIGGWAHSRDLIYVSKLIKAYHTDERVIATLRLAERCGVNTFLTNPQLNRIILKYWKEAGGHIQYISDCGISGNLRGAPKMSVDAGASACYVHGGMADSMAKEGKAGEIGEVVELIRKEGVPAGIGAHKIHTVKACVEKGIKPDFWVKTLHHHKYWSARPNEESNDNRFCDEPEETIKFMSTLPQPWIAFKVLAAGAIMPDDGFRYAFNNGADFICVGMYDFQIVEDVNIAANVLGSVTGRTRPWRA
jgi:uncharacterized membrane protein YphA (DoxX/SURF4 family)